MSTQSRLVITSSESDSSDGNVLCSDDICVEVSTDDIRVGDSVLILPGETIPVDVSYLTSVYKVENLQIISLRFIRSFLAHYHLNCMFYFCYAVISLFWP